MWCVSGEAQPLPLAPVVTMVLTLHKLAVTVSSLTRSFLAVSDDTFDTSLPSVCGDAITQCNQLAVSVLGVLKSSETGKGLSPEVQAYSQRMTHAGKTLNQLIKRGTIR